MAQRNNTNAVTHGLHRNFNKLDKRTREARAIRHAELVIGHALGNLSPQESVIVHQIAVGMLRLGILEQLMTSDPGNFDRDELYLKWSRDVRDGLRAIGLSERSQPVESLQDYLRARSADEQTDHDTTSGTRADRKD